MFATSQTCIANFSLHNFFVSKLTTLGITNTNSASPLFCSINSLSHILISFCFISLLLLKNFNSKYTSFPCRRYPKSNRRSQYSTSLTIPSEIPSALSFTCSKYLQNISSNLEAFII